MNDFNIAHILLKEYDHDKWNSLPGNTKKEIINYFLEFRNRLIVAAIIGNANELFRNEINAVEQKYMRFEIKAAKQTPKIKDSGHRLKFIEIKTESELKEDMKKADLIV